MRVVNVVTGESDWEPIAYIPMVRKQKEPSADLRARDRRSAILQRVLYLAFRTSIAASHVGVLHEQDGTTYVAFPRLLLYLSDQPEEKAVLCLKGGSCKHPCSSCLVHVSEAGAPEALNAEDRNAMRTLERQLEGAAHKRFQRESLRRTELEAMESAHNRVPALAGMAGLSTAPFLLYKTIGFDALHVRCHLLSSLRAPPSFSHPGMVVSSGCGQPVRSYRQRNLTRAQVATCPSPCISYLCVVASPHRYWTWA